MAKCEICGDTLQVRDIKEKVYKGMGVWRTEVVGQKLVCPYCIWKGNTGPGAELKAMIQTHNTTCKVKNHR